MEKIIENIIQWIIAPAFLLILGWYLNNVLGKPKPAPTETPKEPAEPPAEPTIVDHAFFDEVKEFQRTIRYDYGVFRTSAITDLAVHEIFSHLVSILHDVYQTETDYWQMILGNCKRTDSCVECVASAEDFEDRELRKFDEFVDLFSFFYNYYDYTYDEVLLFKRIINTNNQISSTIRLTREDIVNICRKDSVCLKKKYSKILTKLAGMLDSLDNKMDLIIVDSRTELAEYNEKTELFKTRFAPISVKEMNVIDVKRWVENSDGQTIVADLTQSFELHEDKSRG